MGVSFKIKSSKSKDKDKSKLWTIYVRIAMKGKTADISTHETCLLANWQKTKVKGANAQSINKNINEIKSTVQEIYEHLKKEAPQMLTAALVAKIMIEKVNMNDLLNPPQVKE